MFNKVLLSLPLSILPLNSYGNKLFCKLGLRRAVRKNFRIGGGEQYCAKKSLHVQVNNIFDDFLTLHRAR